MGSQIQLIVGLGNPGHQYAATRHNVGVWFIEQLCLEYQGVLKFNPKFHGLYSSDVNFPCHLLVPTTFMNHSSHAVLALSKFYHIPVSNWLIAHDDLDLPSGAVKFKQGGGSGGHNGLKDIIASCGDPNFWRLRLGISHPGDRSQVLSYVLGNPSKIDQEKLQQAIRRACTVLPPFIKGETQYAIQTLHTLNLKE